MFNEWQQSTDGQRKAGRVVDKWKEKLSKNDESASDGGDAVRVGEPRGECEKSKTRREALNESKIAKASVGSGDVGFGVWLVDATWFLACLSSSPLLYTEKDDSRRGKYEQAKRMPKKRRVRKKRPPQVKTYMSE